MKEYKLKAAPAALTQEIKNQKAPKAKRILVGIDTGLGNNQASRKVDNAAIGPVQNLRSETEMALYIDKQLELAEEVVVVYEAGPFGYGLYRQLTARGAKCLVCAPDSTQQKRKRRRPRAGAVRGPKGPAPTVWSNSKAMCWIGTFMLTGARSLAWRGWCPASGVPERANGWPPLPKWACRPYGALSPRWSGA